MQGRCAFARVGQVLFRTHQLPRSPRRAVHLLSVQSAQQAAYLQESEEDNLADGSDSCAFQALLLDAAGTLIVPSESVAEVRFATTKTSFAS